MKYDEMKVFGLQRKEVFGFGASASWETIQCIRIISKFLLKYDIYKKSILNIGCGIGALEKVIMEKFKSPQITAIDLSDHNINIAKNNVRNVNFERGDAEELHFGDETFDVVIMDEVLEQLPNPQKTLVEIRRVLTKDGIAIIIVPLRPPIPFIEFINDKIRPLLDFNKKNVSEEDEVHMRLYSISSFKEEISRYFTILELRRYNFITLFMPLVSKMLPFLTKIIFEHASFIDKVDFIVCRLIYSKGCFVMKKSS